MSVAEVKRGLRVLTVYDGLAGASAAASARAT